MGTVTISGQTVTIYGDETGSRNYWKTMLDGDAWESSSDRKQALVTATRWMDAIGLTDPDTGDTIAPTTDDSGIDTAVIEACYELANALISDSSIRDGFTTGGNNNKRLKAGSAEIEFFRPIDGGAFPPQVLRLLSDYIGSYSSSNGNEAFGTDVEQPFTSSADPDLNEGWA